jgi:hypothetical protein
MLFTTAAALLVGLVRWYVAMSHPVPVAQDDAAARPRTRTARSKARPGFGARITAALAGTGSEDDEGRPIKARHASRTKRPDPRTSGRQRPARQERPAPSRGRHSRPTREDEMPPRTRREPPRRSPRDVDAPPPRRRPGPGSDAGSRAMPLPPPPRRDPRQAGSRSGPPGYEPRDVPRDLRREYPGGPRDPRDAPRHARPTRTGRAEPAYPPRPDVPRYPGYPPPPEAPRRRPPNHASDPVADPRGGYPGQPTGTHHPVSRVRYRSADRDFQEDNRR